MRKHQNFINFLSKQTLISRSLSQSKKIRRIYDGDTRLPCMDLVVVWIGEERREEMEESSYVCGINHLDGDNRLPPRKRLLAGLKKQNCDHNSASPSSISSSFSSRLNNLLNSNSKSSRLSPDEILDASKSAALAAAKVAAAARARATEKAEVAAKAVAAAKNALELVASVSEEETSGKERSLRKNKSKKHVPVELLYKKRRSGMKSETDEEIARKLHRAMNSSPRISKGSLPSDLKTHNHKKHRKQLKLEKCRVSDGGELRAARPPSVCVRISEAGDMNFRGRVDAVELLSMDRKDKQDVLCNKADHSDMVDISPPDRETEASYLNDKYWQVAERGGTTGRKRGRIKQKKLSLSLCTIRDRENPKEEPKSNGFPSMKEPHGKCAAEMPLFSANPSTKDPMVTTGSAL